MRDRDVAVYDSGEHRIGGVQQAQGTESSLVFSSHDGPVRIDALRKL